MVSQAELILRVITIWFLVLSHFFDISALTSLRENYSFLVLIMVKLQEYINHFTIHIKTFAVVPSGQCQGDPFSGTCSGIFVGWTYKTSTQRCHAFTWGSCSGQRLQNNYDSQQACQQACQQGFVLLHISI